MPKSKKSEINMYGGFLNQGDNIKGIQAAGNINIDSDKPQSYENVIEEIQNSIAIIAADRTLDSTTRASALRHLSSALDDVSGKTKNVSEAKLNLETVHKLLSNAAKLTGALSSLLPSITKIIDWLS